MTTEGLISLFTLTMMEIILGIDNVIFISIVSNRVEGGRKNQESARRVGIVLALFVRIALLFGITWIIGLSAPLFTLPFLGYLNMDTEISGRDLILLAGGLFLIAKSTAEIHGKLEGEADEAMGVKSKKLGFMRGIFQIILIDIVFSFDSILTAVGLVKNVAIMVIAVVISLGIMLAFAGKISDFIEKHPTVKMLALTFLVLIGFLLVVEAFGEHVPKGYVYFAMAFAFIVEMLNLRLRNKTVAQVLDNDDGDDS